MPGRLLERAERTAFACVAAVLYGLAFIVLVYGSATFLAALLTEPQRTIGAAGRLLDAALLILILLQVAYALTLKTRGALLGAEPFITIAVLAIVRRMLAVAAGVAPGAAPAYAEIAVLAGAAMVVASALALVRRTSLRS